MHSHQYLVTCISIMNYAIILELFYLNSRRRKRRGKYSVNDLGARTKRKELPPLSTSSILPSLTVNKIEKKLYQPNAGELNM